MRYARFLLLSLLALAAIVAAEDRFAPWPGADATTDSDGDGVLDAQDNCPNDENPLQEDADVDGIGDVCDTEGPFPAFGNPDCSDGFDNDGDGLTDGDDPDCPAPGSGVDSWAVNARIAGAAVWVDIETFEIDQIISDMVAQHVTVIEADSDLSNYLTDAEFNDELALMSDFAAAAHAAGLKVVWYYPTLEVLTPDGANIPDTMYKDHPDWVQICLNGEPNVFYGGDGRVHWVEPDMESAWMSVESPYRDYYLDRVEMIAGTGIDGLWADVPLLADMGPDKWSDINPYATAQFTADTGLTAPTVENWNDPTWRRWIAWRHQEIAKFLRDVADTAQSVDPEFPLIVETVTMDYNAATVIALDGADLKPMAGVTHVWEVDALSDGTANRRATEDDWISYIAMNKYARAASGNKPAWVFTYGKQTNDAELMMAEALAAGNNPYETKIPEMTTTVGAAYRTLMYGWINDNEPYLFGPDSGAEVAVLYSSPSRDYVDKGLGVGLYVNTQSNDDLWWSTDEVDSAYQRQYVAEYRGMVKLLVHTHTPFDIVASQALTLEELTPYETVVLPDVEALSESEASVLQEYVWNGGNLIVTGPNPTGLDEYGSELPEYALADVLGFSKSDPLPEQAQHQYGAGEMIFYSALLGKSYFVTSDASALATLSGAVEQTSTIPLSTDADRRVHIELSRADNEMVLQFVNFIGMDGSFSVVPTSFSVSLTVPAGKQVAEVALTSPDLPTTALDPISYSEAGQVVTFDVSLQEYSLVVVSLEDTATLDSDDDGYYDGDEAFMGTDHLTACPTTSTANDEDPDAWPPDFDDNQFVNITDVVQVIPPYFGSGEGDPDYSERRDLAPDGFINITDVVKVLPPVFGSSCTP